MDREENKMLTDERISEIQKRADAATPGPWEVVGDRIEPDIGEAWSFHGAANSANGVFIAHSRTDVPDLLAERAELLAEVERLRVRPTAENDQALVKRLRPHELTPGKGVVYATADLMREAAERIEDLGRACRWESDLA